ncbi:MAG: hypothetical protein RLZZ381_2833, partial [Cyanobacteriota bacterium]
MVSSLITYYLLLITYYATLFQSFKVILVYGDRH